MQSLRTKNTLKEQRFKLVLKILFKEFKEIISEVYAIMFYLLLAYF